MIRAFFTAIWLLAFAAVASGQSTVLQGGPWAPGHAPMYVNPHSSQPVIQDSGPAVGGAAGLGMSEGLYVARGTGTPPYIGQGTGPSGTNWCDYDAPTTNATGYHYLCFSPNVGSAGLITYGAGGAAHQQPLNLNINGTTYPFPFALSGVVGPGTTTVGHLATWNNTTGTLLADTPTIGCANMPALTGGITNSAGSCATTITSIVTPNIYFHSNSPWVDVKAYGASGDGVTDDTTAIQNAITAGAAATVYFPPGHYCVKGSSGVTVSVNTTHILGTSEGFAFVDKCGTLGKLFTLDADTIIFEHMDLLGAGLGATSSQNALELTNRCLRCRVTNNTIFSGFFPILDNSLYAFITNNRVDAAIGNALIAIHGGGDISDNQFDMNWPVSFPGAGGLASISAWTAGHNYTVVGTVVSTGGYYIQLSVPGVSGAGAPTLQPYGVPITDGAATWKLVANTTTYGAYIGSGTFALEMQYNDQTGPFTAGIKIDKDGAAAPSTVHINDECTTGETISFGIEVAAGNDIEIGGCQIQGVVFTGGVGIYVHDITAGDVDIHDSTIFATTTGVEIDAGTNTGVNGNTIVGETTAIRFGANVTKFTAEDNRLCPSATWGPNTNTVVVAVGASDYYNIIGNLVCGVAVSDGGTGIHKTLSGNN